MAIFYIDLVNGNDANSGVDWANAWKTFTTGATAARIAPGDEIRVSETSAPTSIGTATWTNEKVGNSITFASAPTKQIDTAKTGWVTMGAGSTVTNGQTTAYMTPVSFGGTTMGALQWVTSATTNGCYKTLSLLSDYSAHQQVSFWFRSNSAFDCTGSQDMFIELCSDTLGAVVVNTLTFPNWSFAANMWYPIVIDYGSALSSTVNSVRFRTANTTSQTFYVDEIFASPAGGLTLRSLIGLNDNDWHAIRCIRDADVQLLAGFLGATAIAGASSVNSVDASWMGTTQTSTTYKLEPSIDLLPTTGPGATFCVNQTEVATAILPHKFSGGWNTSTGLQSGVTFFDNVTHTNGSAGINMPTNPYLFVENFGFVRFAATVINAGANNFEFNQLTMVACQQNSQMNGAHVTNFVQNLINNWGITQIGFKSVSGCHGSGSNLITQNISQLINKVNGNSWGCTTAGSVIISLSTASSVANSTITFGNVYPANCSAGSMALSLGGANTKFVFGAVKACASAQPIGISFGGISSASNVVAKIGEVKFSGVSTASLFTSSSNNTLIIDTLSNPAGNFFAGWSGNSDNNCVRIFNNSSGGTLFSTNTSSEPNTKLYFHNWGGVADAFRVYVGDKTNAVPGYFELQSTDVYTSGSKAVRFTGTSFTANTAQMFIRYDLKLASAAAEANKLVTVTARVKRNSTSVETGIYVPGFAKFVPGYTDDISAVCLSTGSYELLTITFTPTENCVFDVMAHFKPINGVAPDIVWDTLTISQAA